MDHRKVYSVVQIIYSKLSLFAQPQLLYNDFVPSIHSDPLHGLTKFSVYHCPCSIPTDNLTEILPSRVTGSSLRKKQILRQVIHHAASVLNSGFEYLRRTFQPFFVHRNHRQCSPPLSKLGRGSLKNDHESSVITQTGTNLISSFNFNIG